MRRARRRRRSNIQEFTFRNKRYHFNVREFVRGFLNWILLIFVAVILGYAVVTFFFQTVTVVGPSMNDTLVDGQVVIVNKVSKIERYDIVAFSQVEDDGYYDIKRVIGLPEETVLIQDGVIYINGEELTDTPFDDKILTAGIAGEEIVLSDDEYFVLGDNVNNSEDSRYTNVGNITSKEILGEVVYIFSPKEYRGKIK